MSKKFQNKPNSYRMGSHEYMVERRKEVIKQEAQMSYRDHLKVYLSFSLKELKQMKSPIYDIVKNAFPSMDENTTLYDARVTKLFDKIFRESSMKALELTFKLDGSMSDLTNEPNYDEVTENTGGIK